MRPDLKDEEDIKRLIDSFYDKVQSDDVIGYIFRDIAQVNWAHHLPRMYAFWSFLLLGTETYHGNPMDVHRRLHEKVPLTEAHFDRWLQLFHTTVDDLFEGQTAEDAKQRATLIAMTWKPKFVRGY